MHVEWIKLFKQDMSPWRRRVEFVTEKRFVVSIVKSVSACGEETKRGYWSREMIERPSVAR